MSVEVTATLPPAVQVTATLSPAVVVRSTVLGAAQVVLNRQTAVVVRVYYGGLTSGSGSGAELSEDENWLLFTIGETQYRVPAEVAP
jgi:hypothetical protein